MVNVSLGADRASIRFHPIGSSIVNLQVRIAALTLTAVYGYASADEPAKSKLDGTYTIVAGEKNGKEVPADSLKGSIIVFDGDKVLGTDKDKKEFFGSTFVIDKTTTPFTITMMSTAPVKGEKAVGIIEMKDDTVRICYALLGGDAPKEFKTQDKQHCFTMKRAPKSEK